jgi:hypothetical protein
MTDDEEVVTTVEPDPPYVDNGPPIEPDEVPEPLEDPDAETPAGMEP